MPSWEDAIRKIYAEEVEKLRKEPTRWDKYDSDLSSADWRLWDSVEILDMTLLHLKCLVREAERRRRTGFSTELERIRQLIDRALGYLCPMGWKPPRKSFGDITLDERSLRQARGLLSEAFEIWNRIYLDVSLNVEAKRRGAWTLVTPLVWRHLRDAVYGLDRYLAGEGREEDQLALLSTRSDLAAAVENLNAYEWVEFSKTTFRSIPPRMIRTSEIETERGKTDNVDVFISRYRYRENLPFYGPVLSDFYLDIDAEDDLDVALKEARRLVNFLARSWGVQEKHIAIFFTGSKGFHVEVPFQLFNVQPSENLPLIWRIIAQEIKQRASLKHVDLSVYDRMRLWRLLNSKHSKGQRFKIPLGYKELADFSVDQIRELATGKRERSEQDLPPLETRPALEEAYNRAREQVEKYVKTQEGRERDRPTPTTFDMSRVYHCVKRRIEEGIDEGTYGREPTAMYIAAALRGCGASREQAMELVRQFCARCRPPLTDDREIQHAVDSAYENPIRAGWSTPCFAEICQAECREKCFLYQGTLSTETLGREPVPRLSAAGGFTSRFVYETIRTFDIEGLDQWIMVVFDGTKATLVDLTERVEAHRRVGNRRKPRETIQIDGTTYRLHDFPTIHLETLWSGSGVKQFVDNPNVTPDPSEVYENVEQVIRYFCDLDDGSDLVDARYAAKACHVIATYFYDVFSMFPYGLSLGAYQSGKSTDIKATIYQSYHGYGLISNPTPATIFRIVQTAKPTLGLDNVERLYDRRVGLSEESASITEMLDVGAYQGGKVPRVEGSDETGRYVKEWEVYCPKFLSSTKGVAPSLKSRSVPTYMIETRNPEFANRQTELWPNPRQPNGIMAERFRRNRDNLYALRMVRLGEIQKLANELDARDYGLAGRTWDIWRPIFAVAKIFCPEKIDLLRKLAASITEVEKSQKLDEDRTTLLQCLVELYDGRYWYSVKEVTALYREKSEIEKTHSKTVSNLLKVLGFTQRRHSRGGSEVAVSKRVLIRQASVVGIDTSTVEKTEQCDQCDEGDESLRHPSRGQKDASAGDPAALDSSSLLGTSHAHNVTEQCKERDD